VSKKAPANTWLSIAYQVVTRGCLYMISEKI
jgi:hypothetical protein